jgi:dTDP-4-dehydrorhamnose reductase
MKTLIIGSNGMLGSALVESFKDYNPILWTKEDCDITDEESVLSRIEELQPELIINVAAYTNVDGAEENEEIATKINGDAVGCIAQASKNVNATLVHFSTDYVFDGTKQQRYGEDDETDPINAYGRSKLAGEKQILKQVQDDDDWRWYVIRTAWLYGANGKHFVDTMLSMATSRVPLKVVNDQFGSPTYTVDLAHATRELIESKVEPGIYHRTNSGTCTWYEFAKEIFKVFDMDVEVSPCTTKEFPRPAKRPKYSILKTTKLDCLRSWQHGLRNYRTLLTK